MIASKVVEGILIIRNNNSKTTKKCKFSLIYQLAVDAAYTEDVPPDRKADLQKLSENLSLEALMITFRRFIFR